LSLDKDAANRYCVSVQLYGDESGQGKEGAWNLLFAAADGSRKHVLINMQGEGSVSPWNGPVDEKSSIGRRTDLGDIRRRLEDVFSSEGIKANVVDEAGGLLITYKTRQYQVYPQRKDGNFAESLQAVSGPAIDGIWLQLRVVDQPDRRAYAFDDNGPYWRWLRGTYFLAQPGKFLAVDLRYGANVKWEVRRQIVDAFGEHAPSEW
jgi:hypothetical protein